MSKHDPKKPDRNRTFLRVTGLGVFLVVRPLWISVFIFIAVALGLIMHVLNHTAGLKTTSGSIVFFLYGFHLFISGIVPIVSSRWRDQLCRPRADIKDAMFGLIALSSTGLVFNLYGIYIILSSMLGISFSEAGVDFFFTYILNYLVLVGVCSILVWKIRKRRRESRRGREVRIPEKDKGEK